MQAAQVVCNVQRHSPTGTPHTRQADVTGYAGDMCVQWNYQLPRCNAPPYAAVHAVLRTDHPSQIEIQTFACAAFRGTGKEKPHSCAPLEFTAWIKLLVAESKYDPAEIAQCRTDVFLLRREAGRERRFERPVILQRSANNPEKYREIAACIESMVEAAKAAQIGSRVEGADCFCRGWSQVPKDIVDCPEHALDVPIRESRGEEAHDFAIPRIFVSMNELDGIVEKVLFPGEIIDKRVQVVLEEHMAIRGKTSKSP